MKQGLLILSLFFAGFSIRAQEMVRVDLKVLLKDLSAAKEDTNKVLLLLRIGRQYEFNTPDSAIKYYEAARDLSKKIGYKTGIFKYISNYTAILNSQNKYEESLQLNLQSIDLAKEINNPKLLTAAYCNTGGSYYGLRLYDKCIDYFLKATTLAESRHDTVGLITLYSNLTALYSELQQESSKAYSYGLKSLTYGRLKKDTMNIISALQNTSGILTDMKKYDSALVLLHQAYELSAIVNNKYGQMSALVNTDNIYSKLRRYDLLKDDAEKILVLATELEEPEGQINAYYYFGKYYFEQKNFALSKENLIKAIQLSKENELRSMLSKSYALLSDIELGLGNLKAYHRNAFLADSVGDIISSDKIQRNIQDFEAKYSLDKKQREIDLLNSEKEIEQLQLRQRTFLSWSLAVGMLVILLIGFLYYRTAQQKKKLLKTETELKQQKINELETEKQLLATQFILQGQEEERKRLARDLHDGLGSILSGARFSFNNMKQNLTITPENAAAFERSVALLDQSIKELRRVAHNMMPEALMKFGLDTALRDFCTQVAHDHALQLNYQSFDMDDESIPQAKAPAVYRIVQELVNNILKHADAKNALVQLIKKGNALSITVEDDGKGFDMDFLRNSKGIGYLSLQNRVAYLEGKMDVESIAGKGTSVNIEIPNIGQ
jgi:signal transduction histidine kinase